MPIGNNIGGGGGGGGSSSNDHILKQFFNDTIEEYTLPVINYSPDKVNQLIELVKLSKNSAVVNIKPGAGQTIFGDDPNNFTIQYQGKLYQVRAISETQWSILSWEIYLITIY